MGWGELWEKGAQALIAGDVGSPIPPPPWKNSTENHRAGLYSTRYWQAVRAANYSLQPDTDLRDWLRRQREEGLFLSEALGPVYDSAWVASLLIAWTAARERLSEGPGDLPVGQVGEEIESLSLGAIRFALGMALALRVPDGTVFAPGPRAKDLETAGHMERGLTILAHEYSWAPAGRPDLLRHLHLRPEGRWLQQHAAARFIIALTTPELKKAIDQAGGPTLQGRLSHPLYWTWNGDTLDAWAPWLHVRDEGGGAHGRSGVWANFGWKARSRDDAEPVWRKGGKVPEGGIARHPTRDDGNNPGRFTRNGGSYVGPDSDPWPLANVATTPDPPPVEEPEESGGPEEDDAPPLPLAEWRVIKWLTEGGCPPHYLPHLSEITRQAQRLSRDQSEAESLLRTAVADLDIARTHPRD